MKVLIGGDISVNDSAELFARQNEKALFNDLIPAFQSADRVVVNVECAITNAKQGIEKIGPCLKAPIGTAETLKKAGITDCMLSNNHIFDFGSKGALDTIAELEKNGLQWTGFGENNLAARKNLILSDGKVRVALIAVCEHEYSYALPNRIGAREYDPYDTNDDIVEAKKNADFVVVTYHGGKEHCRYPSPRLRKLCRSMIKHGADVVLCQHSHCIGCYENFEHGHILYGQGNFHFVKEQNSQGAAADRWNNGLLVELQFNKEFGINFLPVVVDGLGIRFAGEKEKAEILSSFERRSESLKTDEWRKGWKAFCLSSQGLYEKAAQSYGKDQTEQSRQWFAHYLDCESHTDVWRELFPTWNNRNE